MPKRISIEIPDENYEELSSLSKSFKQDVNQTVTDTLEVMVMESKFLENISKEYKVLITPKMILSHTFDAARRSMELFNEILEKIEAKGLFMLEDFEFNLDEFSFTFTYAALEGSNTNVYSFCLTLESGVKTLRADSIIEVSKVGEEALENLEKVVQDFVEQGHEEFEGVETYDIDVEQDDPEFAHLVITCVAETLENFPSVKELSQIIGKLFKKSGIIQKH
jgi:hypothetical protein